MTKAANSPNLFRHATERIGRGLDTLLAPLAPGLALRRLQSRAAFRTALSTYDFARRDRTTADFPARTTSADQAVVPDLATATPRARQIARDSWMGKSAISAYLRHVVGTGISCRPVGRDPASDSRRPEGEWKDFNRSLASEWRRWMRNRSLVDLEGKTNLLGVQRWGIRELVTVGECFLVLAYRPNLAGVGLVLQRIEQEQLAQEISREASTGNEVRAGIEIDGDGRMVALHVYTGGHRLEYGYNRSLKVERIPAERVLPLWDLERVRQTHGISGFHAVGIKLWNTDCYDHNENVAKRVEAAICAVRTSGPSGATAWGGLATPAGQSTRDGDNNRVTDLAPGMIIDCPEGGGINLLNPQRPGAIYDPYMRLQISEIAAGVEMDPAMLLRDFSRANFSGQRQGLLEFWGVTDILQELVAEQWLRPIWEAFVALAIAEGRVRPPAAYFTDDAIAAECLEMDWQPPPKYWIDPAREAAAVKLKVDLGLTTLTRELDKLGYTYEETVDEKAEEQDYADAKGVTFGSPGGVSPFEPRPGSTAGGDNSGNVPDPTIDEPKMRRRPGHNGDWLHRAILEDALREGN
jgi:lambda family phage portal protein